MLLAGALISANARLEDSSAVPPLEELDAMHDDAEKVTRTQVYGRIREAVEALGGQENASAALLWRFARAAYGLTEDPDRSHSERESFMREALSFAEAAVERDPRDHNARRWYGIILSSMGEFISTTEHIQNTYKIREQWEKAVELQPRDASAYHLLGRWAFDVANVPWWKRRVASTLFAAPPDASVEDALFYFQRAEEISPGFWKANQVMLARCEELLGHHDKAVEWAQSAARLPVRTHDDETAHREARQLLARLSGS